MAFNENKPKMTITHIYHSGVIIEADNILIIIDYFHEKESFEQKEFLAFLEKHKNKDFYYFVTHGHQDHFDNRILTPQFQSLYGTTYYVFSNDLEHYKKEFSTLFTCSPDKQFTVGDLNVTTFGSTDQGVSYLIESPNSGIHIFHSGDLNWWHWKSFSPDELEKEKNDYLKEVYKLQHHLKAKKALLDVAFVPVDPRLEEFYHLAGEVFLERIEPKKMFPLHFRNNYASTKKFKEHYDKQNRFQVINHSLETIEVTH